MIDATQQKLVGALGLEIKTKSRVSEYYRTGYDSGGFEEVYHTVHRAGLYEHIARILLVLKISYVLDIGCSIGGLVELLNQNGMDAWGCDFDIGKLRAKHALLQSQKKFLYGDFSELQLKIPRHGSAITLLDTLRYIASPSRIPELDPEFIIIKEVASGPWGKSIRKNQFQLKLYAPADCLMLLPTYRVHTLYGPRFAFRLRHPTAIALQAANLMPTYTLVLQRV